MRMTKKINIKGDIVDDQTSMFYDFFGMQSVSPSKVAEILNDDDDSDEPDNDTVTLDVASNGGDVFAASEIYSMLRDYKGAIHVNVQGLAASAASVIAMAGDKVSIAPTAQIMIHKASSNLQGNSDDLEHEAGILSGIDDSIAAAYEAKTGLGHGELLNLMANETWLGAKDAVDKGFADEIMFADENKPQVVNSVSSVPPKSAINKFLNLIYKADLKPNKPEPSQPKDSLRDQKLAILMQK